MSVVHLVVPGTVQDGAHPSGGSVYDVRLAEGLDRLGWSVQWHLVPGAWPHPDAQSLVRLHDALATVPDGAVTLVDGLVASCAPQVLVPSGARLQLVVLMHMPLGGGADGQARAARRAERQVLAAARVVVTTSRWTRQLLLDLYGPDAGDVVVAEPGVDPAPPAAGSPSGDRLLCVAAVTPTKGHDLLLAALEDVVELPWRLTCAGALDLDPGHATAVQARAARPPLSGRVHFAGPVTGAALDRLYAASDLLLVPSRSETYGLVVTEALARGIPVVAAAVGGVPEALGVQGQGNLPGILVPPGDTAALAGAVRAWLGSAVLRAGLRASANSRRATLTPWSRTARVVSDALPVDGRRPGDGQAGEPAGAVPRPPA